MFNNKLLLAAIAFIVTGGIIIIYNLPKSSSISGYDLSKMSSDEIAEEMMFLVTNIPDDNERFSDYLNTCHYSKYTHAGTLHQNYFSMYYNTPLIKVDSVIDSHFKGMELLTDGNKNYYLHYTDNTECESLTGIADVRIYDYERANAICEALCKKIVERGYGSYVRTDEDDTGKFFVFKNNSVRSKKYYAVNMHSYNSSSAVSNKSNNAAGYPYYEIKLVLVQ